jgi:hypothetical protein
LAPIAVEYIGESAIDIGGVTRDLFTEFFGLIQRDTKFFECDTGSEGNPSYLPVKDDVGADSYVSETQMEIFGLAIVKCLMECPSVCSYLPPSLFRFLLNSQ